jgi:hypothetical protein
LNNLNQFEFDFELNLTATRKCSRGMPVSAPASPISHDHASSPTRVGFSPVPAAPRRPTTALDPHAVPSPSLLRGRHPPSAPPFPLPSPTAPLKRRFRHRRAPFLSPPVLVPSRARSSPPPPAPLPPVCPGHRRHRHPTEKSKPPPPLQPLMVSSPLRPPSSSLPTSPHPYVDLSCCRASLRAPSVTRAHRQSGHAIVADSSPPHHRAIGLLSAAPPHLAQRLHGDPLVLVGRTSSSAEHHRAADQRATARGDRAASAPDACPPSCHGPHPQLG